MEARGCDEVIAHARAFEPEHAQQTAEQRLPAARQIDRPLVVGGLAFGVGWGLAGYCPGPAVVALGAGQDKAVVFVIAMIAGMALFEAQDRVFHARRRRRVPRELSDVAGDA